MRGIFDAARLNARLLRERLNRHLAQRELRRDFKRWMDARASVPKHLRPTRSKYTPHQGAAECARRRERDNLGEFRPGRAA